jgi:predicted oxidoreductase (fatty acid repression mutant protein)
MEKTLKDAITHRRSYYAIGKQSTVSDAEIEEIIRLAVTHVPSAFNSQSSRVVLLLGEHHTKLWSIAKETLRKIVPADAFAATEQKLDSFDAGYGTVLFFEDQSVVQSLQKQFALYAENFPVWADQESAMQQYAVWTLLENAGFGASLQHYNPLINDEVSQTWNLPQHWKMTAQMPFGTPLQEPAPKNFQPLENRFLTFK